MSKAVRTALLLVTAGIFIILVVWILLLPTLQAMPTGRNVRVFGTFENFPTSRSYDQDSEKPPTSSYMSSMTPSRLEIEGEEPTPTSTLAFEAALPLTRPLTSAVCRTGPTTCEPALAYLTTGHVLPAMGKTLDGLWLKLVLIPTELSCWVRADLLVVSGDLALVPELDPDTQPCATPSPTDAPPGCWVIDAQHPNGTCRPGTCTPNDVPGTSCTPP